MPSDRRLRRPLVRGLLALSLLFLAACAPDEGRRRLIVLGIDGLDPRVVDLLMSEGRLTNFAKLRREGAYGRLKSSPPLLSPVIWTTIATGKTPDRHGIGHFTALDPDTGEEAPVSSDLRRVKALWNILSDQGRRVAVVGWWATWPAESVEGAIVSDRTCYHFLSPEGRDGGPGRELTYPPELATRLAPLVRRPGDVGFAELSRYVHVSPEEHAQPFAFDNEVGHFKWALATAESYRTIGLQLWQSESPDLLMAYVEATDSTSHLFGHLFRGEGLSGELADQQQKFGDAVEQMYLYADELVGDYLEVMDETTTLAVMSDHGFELGKLQDDPSKTRDMRRVSERFHRDEGVLYLYGRGVREHARIEAPRLLDVAPTLLALTNVAPARDMPGRVLEEALVSSVPERAVATYEADPKDETRPARAGGAPADREVLDHLEALGYIDDGDGGRAVFSPQGERNIGAVLFAQKRYQESAEHYERLVRTTPDDAVALTGLGASLGALGRYDEALSHLDRAIAIDPLNPASHHNRAVILERRGEIAAAVAQYQTAVRYDSQYEASRQALVRLTGSPDVNPAGGAAEARALELARKATEAARRGAYSEALRHLEEAERVAPDYVVVYQHRSNVAYLMGDVPGAIRALERALELEPDNALYRHNLESLRRRSEKDGS